MHLDLITLIVPSYDNAIHFFVTILGFNLVSDTPSTTTVGKSKRWVVVRPPGATTGILLAQADGPMQDAAVGDQFAGRVGLFLRVDDFKVRYERMKDHGVEFLESPRDEPYGRVAVFRDLVGNRWDLLGPVPIMEGSDSSDF
jgi:catechol 2,3-dioxygenase-like lactoylglutathione lyase family enzyme